MTNFPSGAPRANEPNQSNATTRGRKTSNLGNALKDKGELEEAVRRYRRAIAIKPDFVDAHVNLSWALLKQGNLSEAAASARRALAIRPRCLEASTQLAAALADQGRSGDAAAS